MWLKSTVFSLRKEIDKLNSLFNFYCTSIQDVNIEENEEAVTEVLKETSSSRNELATLSETVSFLIKILKNTDISFVPWLSELTLC